jgi:hypothetical protein
MKGRRIPGQMNLTLAASYGRKPGNFGEFIRWCQAQVAVRIPEGFRPYELTQVHATIVGLDGVRTRGDVVNHSFSRYCKDPRIKDRRMNLEGLVDYIAATSLFPFEVRIGGFRRGGEYPFKSHGEHPYFRSFAIQKSNLVVAMSWPESEKGFPDTLDHLRRDFNVFNIRHKYHKTDKDVDNDLFFVLGKVDPGAVTNLTREAVSEAIRAQIAGIAPIYITVGCENLSFVAYVSDELPLATSVVFSLEDAQKDISAIKELYREGI